MRWFWQRRRQKQESAKATAIATQTGTGGVQRTPTTSGRLGQPRQLTGELLVLARDYLQGIGGHVRVEDEDVLSATLADGSLVRYTTTLAKARADESATLLVEGSEALAEMLADIATRSRYTALRLPPAADPVALGLAQCAALAANCGHCLMPEHLAEGNYTVRCEQCPLREGRMVLRWRASGPLTARVIEQQPVTSVELAYLVAARDRQGRRDEWLRCAVDAATGQAVPVLTETQLATGEASPVPPDSSSLLAHARAAAEVALRPQLSAMGTFLRLRSLDEYQRRIDEVGTTFDRLQRETPETARAAKTGRSRELAALSEVYAIDVVGQLESACFVTSSVATVAVRPAKGHGELLLRVDLGRQVVLPPRCIVCGDDITAGLICDGGHVTCASCAAACAKCGAWICDACGEVRPDEPACPHCGTVLPSPITSTTVIESPRFDGAFTVEQLQALPPEMLRTAVDWLLQQQGISAETHRISGETLLVHGSSAARKIEVAIIRPPCHFALDETDVRLVASRLGVGRAEVMRMLLTTAPATAAAHALALQFDITLTDRSALQTLLDGFASAYQREQSSQLAESQARADAASRARQTLLDVLETAERTLTPLKRSRRASGQTSTSVSTIRAVTAARMAIERAALAWETLLADWAAAFSERPARSGTLVVGMESSRFDEMAERAAHLQMALIEAITALAETPARGDASYEALRRAILDECSARCEGWRWRIRTYDPAQWQDFDRAWNAKAAAKAAEATNAAGHATARADKAQSQAQRAG